MYDDEEQLDITSLRYVVYARKSTDDPKRQMRSIPDQIDECKQFAKRLGIQIVYVVDEEKSAKKPGQRPKFAQLLKDIRAKKYDGIIAWNPDRLARNMKEGGEIIDMVDEEVIKDLKFVTHHFTPDANGKMLLGMAFVLSKQYSDKLSQDVTRGVRKGLAKGLSSGTPKHGYIRSEDGIYRPDGNNFNLICAAWKMRAEGQSLESIASYMNENGYARTFKENAKNAGKKVLMTDKILSSTVFPDPFYYGILVQKEKQVDLRLIDGYDFQPATDEDNYNHVQALTGRRIVTDKKRRVFKPLVGLVKCDYCSRTMYPQTPTSGRKDKTRILSYRCDYPNCPRKNKTLGLTQSIRAKVIFDFMYDHLGNFKVTRDEYDRLEARLKALNGSRKQEMKIKLHSMQGALKDIKKDIEERSINIISLDKNSPIYKTNEKYILDLAGKRDEYIEGIGKLKDKLTDPEEDMLSFNDFLNVANNAVLRLKAADVATKDAIARLIYLNVAVDTEKVVDFQIREPFKTYFQIHKIATGRGDPI